MPKHDPSKYVITDAKTGEELAVLDDKRAVREWADHHVVDFARVRLDNYQVWRGGQSINLTISTRLH